MVKSVEDLRRIINEQEAALLIKAQQRLFLNSREEAALGRLRKKLAEEDVDEPSVALLQKMYKNPIESFELQSASDLARTTIFKNFAKEFGEANIHGDRLHFPNDSQPTTFFKDQADAGHAFLFRKVNCDNYAFSDGKGHYTMGSRADIVSYCEKNSLEPPFGPEADTEERSRFRL
jgi:hypothetical protein